MRDNKVFTKTNLILSSITIAVFLVKFLEMLYLSYYDYIHVWDICALVILIFLIYTIIFAYLSRVVAIRKGIENGYIWGLCLGIIGFIVVCALTEEKKSTNTTNKYEEIEKLQRLKEKGILTTDEFEIEKQKLLS